MPKYEHELVIEQVRGASHYTSKYGPIWRIILPCAAELGRRTKSWKEFISVQLNVDDDRNESYAFLFLDVGLSRALQLRRLSSYVNTHRSVC